MEVLVKDIMSKPVLSIGVDKTAFDAGNLMTENRRGFLVVTKKNNPVGILSDSDLIREIVCKNSNSKGLKISEIMKEPIIVVDADDEILVAVQKMKENNVHRLPVISNGELAGVISLTDIARTSPEMLDLLEYRLRMKEMPFEIKEKNTLGICDSCDNFSEDLRTFDGQWVCEDCREEQGDEV